jgi:hypothetical protein
MRETKMQKSVDLEGLERLVAVSRILKEGEAEVKTVEERVKMMMNQERREEMVSPNGSRSESITAWSIAYPKVKLHAQKTNANVNLEKRISGLRQANEDG